MSSSARRRAWAPPSRRLPVAALAAALLLPLTPAASAGVPGSSGSVPGSVPGAVEGTTQGSVQGTPQGSVQDDEGVDAGLRIVLDSVSPVVLRPGRAATLSGRVINDSATAARLGGVTLSASTSLLGSREEISDWVEGAIDRSTSWVLGEDTVGPLVPAQGETDFSFTVPGSVLGMLPDGPALLAVRISAETEQDGAPSNPEIGRDAELRTVLTSADGDAVDVPLEMSWVVPLTLPPDPGLVNPDPATHAQAWIDAVGADSAVRGWLDHLRLPDVTWLVDPALLVAPRPQESVSSATPEVGEEPGDDQTDDEESGETADRRSDDTEGDSSGGGDGGASGSDGEDSGDAANGEAGASGETAPVPAPVSPAGPSPTTDEPDDNIGTGPVPVPPPDGEAVTEPGPSGEEAVTEPGPSDEEEVTEPSPSDEEGPDDGPDETDVDLALTGLRDRLTEASDGGVWWLPTGDPDLARLADEDQVTPSEPRIEELLTRDLRGTPVPIEVTRLLRSGRQVLWPALGGPTSEDLTRILDLYPTDPSPADRPSPTVPSRPEVAVVPRDSFTASSAAGPRRGAVRVTDSDVLALGADSWTTALIAGGSAEAQEHGAAAATQHLLAHTLGTWLESPTAARELVVAPPRSTPPAPAVLDQLARGWSDAVWLTTVPAGELLDRAAEHDPVTLSGTPPQEVVIGERASLLLPVESPVDDSRGTSLTALSDDLDGLSEILRDTDALRSWTPALDGLWSTRWRQDPGAWPVTWQALSSDVEQTRAAVHIAASTVNFIAAEGTVHVTVVNDLPVAVDDLQLAVTTSNGRLQVLRQPAPVSIGPGSRASVPFDARAVTRGEVILGVELTTPGGTDLGVDEQITVRVQPTGIWIYWVLGGLAGIILLLGLARALPGPPRVPRDASPGGSAYPDPGPTTGPGEEERQ